MGLRSLQRDRGRPYKCDSPGVLKSAITIMEWEKCSYHLQTIQLLHQINRAKILIDHFRHTTFSHIYRELNTEADGLSKLAIGVDMDSIEWEKFDGITPIEQGSINISQLDYILRCMDIEQNTRLIACLICQNLRCCPRQIDHKAIGMS